MSWKVMRMSKILVIGSLNVDIVTNVDHMPVVGETIIGSNAEINAGGKGANQACALGKLGADVAMFGAVGNDLYANIQEKSLESAGVDISRLIHREGVGTGIALIAVDKNGDNSIIVAPGANFSLTKTDIDNNIDLIRECDIVIFQLEIPLDTAVYAAKKAKELGKKVILDPAPVPKEFPEELYQYVDLIKPNETELGMLAHVQDAEENIEKAVQALREKGAGDILVTLGGSGVYINEKDGGVFRIPSKKVEVVDTTAAGDSFTAGLAIMMAEGKSLKAAAEFANCVSAIVVTRKGAQISIPTLEEVKEYMNH